MQFTQEFNIHAFSFHGPAVEGINQLTELKKLDALEELIEECWSSTAKLPSDTEINDFVSYENDFIFESLGIEDPWNEKKNTEEEEVA